MSYLVLNPLPRNPYFDPVGKFKQGCAALLSYLRENAPYRGQDTDLMRQFDRSKKQIQRYLASLKADGRILIEVKKFPISARTWSVKRIIFVT